MFDKILAVIPARGGSKGVKNKNIKLINDKPLIYYTIKAALESEIFSKIMISTDSEDIATIAKECGAEVPFIRPDYLSGDYVPSDDVIEHAINHYEQNGEMFDLVCKLQPTSPMRSASDINNAYSLLKEKKASFVVSVCECEHSPLWTGRIDKSLLMTEFCTENVKGECRQILEKYYRLNGAIYLGKIKDFIRNGSFFSNKTYAYIMDATASIDIDNNLDLVTAEALMKAKKYKY